MLTSHRPPRMRQQALADAWPSVLARMGFQAMCGGSCQGLASRVCGWHTGRAMDKAVVWRLEGED